MRVLKSVFIAVMVIFWGILPLRADEITDLKEKIQSLQNENLELQDKLNDQAERLNNQADVIQQLSSRLDKIEQKEEAEDTTIVHETQNILGMIPKMEFRGYSDFSFKTQKADNRSDSSPFTFAEGELVFIITSELSDKISFLNELAMPFGDDNLTVKSERLYLNYSISELLNIIAGQTRIPLGYWRATYHHGGWFQTPVSRPLVINVLPGHSVGLTFNGKSNFYSLDGEYYLAVYNGRSNLRTRTQNTQDGNDNKAFMGAFTLKPAAISGLGIGSSIYVDKIPPSATPAARKGEINEFILGGHLTYIENNVEFLSEGYAIKHDDEVSKLAFDTIGFYVQAGYKLKDKWIPYYRFDLLDFGQNDPYFSSDSGTTAIDIDSVRHTLGLRWDRSTWNALKLEFNYDDRKGATDILAVTLNDVFIF